MGQLHLGLRVNNVGWQSGVNLYAPVPSATYQWSKVIPKHFLLENSYGPRGKRKQKGTWEWPGEEMNLYSVEIPRVRVRKVFLRDTSAAGLWWWTSALRAWEAAWHTSLAGHAHIPAFELDSAWGNCDLSALWVAKQLKYQKHRFESMDGTPFTFSVRKSEFLKCYPNATIRKLYAWPRMTSLKSQTAVVTKMCEVTCRLTAWCMWQIIHVRFHF